MEFRKCKSSDVAPSLGTTLLSFPNNTHLKALNEEQTRDSNHTLDSDVDIDLREVYFLIMHFLSSGPCQKTSAHLVNELLEHQLLPRRYHAWYSRGGTSSGTDNDDGISVPLSYDTLVERQRHIERDHLVKLLKQMILNSITPMHEKVGRNILGAADVPTLLGTGCFSLLHEDRKIGNKNVKSPPAYLRWPHMLADQIRGLSLREIGGGFTKHHRSTSIRSACYAIAKPSTMVQKMENKKQLRGHRDAVYCAIFDRSGRYVITGSDDRLVKIWSLEAAFCLASCRGHEGDITDLAVSSNNCVVASAANDFVIRVWRLPDGYPISVLRGHTGAVTAIAFSPRLGSTYNLLSSSDDGTCRIWDAKNSQASPRVYVPKPLDAVTGKSNISSYGPSSSSGPQSHQILCCAYNTNGTVFVTGSSDTYTRVWNACRSNIDDLEQPIHEMDVLSGHENDVNYVQFSGCSVAPRSSLSDTLKEENGPKFKNSWFCHDNIVTCSRDGSAIIWVPRSRRSHGRTGRWTRAYHLKVPPPPLPPQPPRGGPRQRLLPTPRGVNMIVWSLDNRFVLAAIMDCRICVWNAVDGSLVHSLTGHSASSYVLDVHPFNPRIAMSAGYDGKTIVWDIWEGTPIQIYEMGPFKLVDGKFSPDGTSIVLSDDVGQIYFVNTGQGESQKDAKYDQFFLGDYRPISRDTLGNVLDQETQVSSYKRNINDPLCDSSMIPYPEPYQSMYQQRRLGALGIEWRPSLMKLAIDSDVSLGQDYQMPPLADLTRMMEPVPEFLDSVYWEPEIEVLSDDNDSEYDVAEEFSSEGEHRNKTPGSSSDPECSPEDSEVEHKHKEGGNRLRRKKHSAEADLMSASGRRIKKRNLDERDGTISGSNKKKKPESGRKTSNRKSSKAKISRPQRVAARNAQHMFSQISGTSSSGENEDDSQGNSSESNSDDSNIQDYESENLKYTTRKESQPYLALKPPECSESQPNTGSRKKLILKLSIRDSRNFAPPKDIVPVCENQAASLYPYSRSHETSEENSLRVNFQDPDLSSVDVVAGERCQTKNTNNPTERGQSEDAGDNLEVSESGNEKKIRWGEVKMRTLKSLRAGDIMLSDASTGLNANSEECKDKVNDINLSSIIHNNRYGSRSAESGIQNYGGLLSCADDTTKQLSFESSAMGVDQPKFGASTSENINSGLKEWPGSNNCIKNDAVGIDVLAGTNCSHELKANTPKVTKLKIRMKGPSEGDRLSAQGYLKPQSPSCMEQHVFSGMIEDGEGAKESSMKQSLHSNLNTSISQVGQERKSSYVTESEYSNVCREENSLNADNHGEGIDFTDAETDAVRRSRSTKLKATSREPNAYNIKLRMKGSRLSDESSKIAGNSSIKAVDQLGHEGMTGRSRSTRNRQAKYHYDDTAKKSSYPAKKIPWLMLSDHEESYHYIPQLGDEVAYLRQGHQEYIESCRSSDTGPWRSLEGKIRAVEVCKVTYLEYAALSGSGDCCCKLELEFVDPSSSVFGKAFKLTLPDLINFPDFVVEKTRYDASIRRNWINRDTCLVWWRNENAEGGNWWEGQIISSQPKSQEFAESPWERFSIWYKTDPANNHRHSPWELHDPDIPWERPHLDFKSRDLLLSALAKLERSASRNQDRHGIQKLKQVTKKLDFLNRFPVPLSPEVIQSRLQNNYYRSLEAVKHDINVMTSNAYIYLARSNELVTKIKRLSEYFTNAFLGLEL